MAHLTFDLLTDYLEKRLTSVEIQQVNAHLVDCLVCRQELTRVEHFVQKLHKHELETPRADLTQDIFTALRQQLENRPQRPFISANPDFDSWATPTPYAMRGATHERQLLYSVEKGDIDLQISYEKAQNLFALRGQILAISAPTDEQPDLLTSSDTSPLQIDPTATNPNNMTPDDTRGVVIRLFTANVAIRQAVTDELGHFRFSDLAPGLYALQVDWHEQRILIEAIGLSV